MSNGFRNAVEVEGVLSVSRVPASQDSQLELVWNNELVNIRKKDVGFRIGCTLVTWDAWDLLKQRVEGPEVKVLLAVVED